MHVERVNLPLKLRLGVPAVSVTLFAVLLVLGPRPRVDLSFPPPEVPDQAIDIPDYLSEGELRFDDIVPGTEKRVLWAHPTHPSRTEFSVVYLHGFSATHRETAPLTEEVARELGANAFLARLTGHGQDAEALGRAVANDWILDTAEALEIGARLGRRVILLGVSTGGTLATWAAAQPEWGDRIAALVLVSPNYGVRDSRSWILTAPWGAHLAQLIEGNEYAFQPENELHRRYWTERYPVRALTEMAALTDLIDEDLVARIGSPTLVFLSPDDRVIDPMEVEKTFASFGSSEKELVWVTQAGDASNHVLAGEILSPNSTPAVIARILSFLQGVTE